MSLRGRLTLIYGGLFMAAGILLLGVTYALFSQQVSGDMRVLIRGTYHQSPPAARPSTAPTKQPAGTTRPPRASTPPGTTTAPPSTTVPPPGAVISPGAWVLNPAGDILQGQEAERALREQVRAAAARSLLVQGSIALALVGALAAGCGWIVAGRVLGPLHRVTDTARRIATASVAGRGLHERIALDGPPDDVKDLADAFDTMVERLDHSFDGQRRFVANASHELRTPLTVGRALVEVAMHRKSASDDVKQLGESLLQINARHEQLITGLLVLADSDKELTARYPVNLGDVVSHVTAQSVAEAAEAEVEVSVDPGDAPTTGDALLLERLVHNLVENGIRHNTRPGWMRVTSRTVGEQVELEVRNTGPDVPPYEVEALFKPFRRLGDDRLVGAKGAGLGLSIVRSVAEAHGGTVEAVPRSGGGLTVLVRLPVDSG